MNTQSNQAIQTKIFGHRGYPAKFPENSLAGFRYVVAHQIDGVEFDVHLTSDRIPVIMHDETIDRTTDGTGRIVDYTLAELRQFKLSNGESIPTLDELLDVFENKDVWINLEFKTDNIAYQDIEKIVMPMVNQHQLLHPVIYSSFNLQTLKNCMQLDATQDYNWLTENNVPKAQEFVKKEHLHGIHPHHYQATTATQRVWTVNDDQEAQQLFEKNVAGIFTNRFEDMVQLRKNVQIAQ